MAVCGTMLSWILSPMSKHAWYSYTHAANNANINCLDRLQEHLASVRNTLYAVGILKYMNSA